MLRVAEVDKGVQVFHGLEHDVAAAAAVAAVRATEFDEFLAAERDDAVAAVAGFYVDLGLVEEFHWVPSKERPGLCPGPRWGMAPRPHLLGQCSGGGRAWGRGRAPLLNMA